MSGGPSGGGGPDPADRDARVLLGALAAVAGLIHVQATVDHIGEYLLFGVLFGVVACAQIGLALALWRTRVSDGVLVASAVMTAGIVAVWLVSRTVGLPVGPGQPEAVGVSDLIEAMIELVFVAVIGAMVRPEGRLGNRLGWLAGGHAVRLGMACASAGMLAVAFGSHAH